MSVTEAALKVALRAEAARQDRKFRLKFAERNQVAIADLQARRERIGSLMLDHALTGRDIISRVNATAEVEAIDAKLAKLQRQAGAFTGIEFDKPLDLDGDPAEQNALPRRLWLRVDLDRAMALTVQWIIDRDEDRRQNEADKIEFDQHHDEIEAEAMAEKYGTPDQQPLVRHLSGN